LRGCASRGEHLHPERTISPLGTVIVRQFSRPASIDDETYYPLDTADDRKMLSQYRETDSAEENVVFGGRLGSYQYMDMRMAIARALQAFRSEVAPLVVS
jgi:UDP-galactopyranose mutase